MPKATYSITTLENTLHEPLYIQLYIYYKQLIEKGTLGAGTKLPSIRKCATERGMSRTTVEAAYMQLAAEGYVMSQPGSGFYVCELNYESIHTAKKELYDHQQADERIKYDFASGTVDYKSFNFDIWRRYIKSALRNTERLLSYGEAQGEYDLRLALCHYVREKRGVVCTPDQIVVGAGVQTLLHILCSLVGGQSSVAFAGNSFEQGQAVFCDRGFEVLKYEMRDNDLKRLEVCQAKLIYTSPSHITAWGDVMPMKTRLELLAYARANRSIIIEDDYDSEFNYYSRPTTSLQGLDGGQNVVYMSTFSKLLLPSLRMSFMVLPGTLVERYKEVGKNYNQTASKAEQIALCQFIRDGHLEKQIKKARKIYITKKDLLCDAIQKIFDNRVAVESGVGGFWVRMVIETDKEGAWIIQKVRESGVLVKQWEQGEDSGKVSLLLSCAGVPETSFEEALVVLKKSLEMIGI